MLIYSTFIGGSDDEDISSIALDASGNAYITGFTKSANFPITAEAIDPSFNDSLDVFVTKLNSSGSALLYSTFIGGSKDESGSSIALDVRGNVYIAGNTTSSTYPTTVGAFDPDFNGVRDVFVTVVDISAPVFATSTTPTVAEINKLIPVSIAVKDDGSGVKAVTLYYKKGGDQTFASVNMTNSSSQYSAIIPASAVTEKGIEFYIRAEDNAGNLARTPAHSIQINIPNGIKRPEPQPAGKEISAFRLISIPLDLFDKTSSNFIAANPGLGADDKKTWRMYAFDRTRQSVPFVEYPNFSISPSQAYLLIVNKPSIYLKTGGGKTVKTAEPDSVPLPQGWSIIGNPFNYDIPRDSVSVTNGTLEIYTLANGSWSLNTTGLKAWEGYAVWVSEPSTLLIKAGKAGLGQGNNLFDIANSDEKNWLIQIKAKLNGTEDKFNFVGQSETAANHYDRMDLHKAPAFGGEVRLEISHSDWQEQAQETFTTDIRQVNPSGQFYDFDILTNTTDGVGTLSFAGIEKLSSDYLVYLVDKTGRASSNLRNNPEHHFAPISSGRKSFRLLVGTREFVMRNSEGVKVFPMQSQLAQNYPNPFNPTTTIQYSLPEASSVRLEIFDLLGRKVRTLVNANQPADNYAVLWDGKDDNGVNAPSGVYFYRLRAGRFEQSKKLILMK
jgi:hypothetical protein